MTSHPPTSLPATAPAPSLFRLQALAPLFRRKDAVSIFRVEASLQRAYKASKPRKRRPHRPQSMEEEEEDFEPARTSPEAVSVPPGTARDSRQRSLHEWRRRKSALRVKTSIRTEAERRGCRETRRRKSLFPGKRVLSVNSADVTYIFFAVSNCSICRAQETFLCRLLLAFRSSGSKQNTHMETGLSVV